MYVYNKKTVKLCKHTMHSKVQHYNWNVTGYVSQIIQQKVSIWSNSLCWSSDSVQRCVSNSRCRYVVKLEDPRPITRHLIFRYCWNMDNNSSRWFATGPFHTWFIAKHGDFRLSCTGNCSQYQLTLVRPSQCNSIHTDTAAWLLACVPAINNPVLCTLQYIYI